MLTVLAGRSPGPHPHIRRITHRCLQYSSAPEPATFRNATEKQYARRCLAMTSPFPVIDLSQPISPILCNLRLL